jgi:hypothetical protein
MADAGRRVVGARDGFAGHLGGLIGAPPDLGYGSRQFLGGGSDALNRRCRLAGRRLHGHGLPAGRGSLSGHAPGDGPQVAVGFD